MQEGRIDRNQHLTKIRQLLKSNHKFRNISNHILSVQATARKHHQEKIQEGGT
jgi:hypothetical protein